MLGRLRLWLASSMQRKVALLMLGSIAVLLTAFVIYDVQSQRNSLQDALLAKGQIMAQTGAQTMGSVLQEAISSHQLSRTQVFDTRYQAIPNTNPKKYHTAYDRFMDSSIQKIEDAYLDDADVAYALAEDINGYVPTHNTVFSKPLTGNYDTDLANNRTKRIFNDAVGITVARNTQPVLRQSYRKDTGQMIWDISAPIMVDGQHWGGFRAGLSLARIDAQLTAITWHIVLAAIALLLALVAATFLFTRPIRLLAGMAAVATKLSQGDVEQTITIERQDEIGQLARAFRQTIGYMQSLATSANHMAQGDLTVQVAPQSEQDALGTSFARMLTAMRQLIRQVVDNATTVEAASGQLAQTSEQIGEASTQIAKAIEEVARGAGEQGKTAGELREHTGALIASIGEVADGVARQLAAAMPITQALEDMATAIGAANQSLASVVEAADQAHASARDGGTVVAQTVASIESVRAAVTRSADQVATLGRHSAEIGQIVEAIDDIAAQTNLLALNAAIEAARAGEHGKGFTVVAAEVRKLAERSSSETKEITGRITAIQAQVREVVAAMQAARAAVEESAALGGQTQGALDSIVTVVGGTQAQVTRISAANENVAHNVKLITGLARSQNQVAEETAQATETMRARSERVERAIESIASASEQSAASAEEVSASTQEQTAGVEEMNAGVQELAALAARLRAAVGAFELEAGQAVVEVDQPVQRRRHTDWKTSSAAQAEAGSARRLNGSGVTSAPVQRKK